MFCVWGKVMAAINNIFLLLLNNSFLLLLNNIFLLLLNNIFLLLLNNIFLLLLNNIFLLHFKQYLFSCLLTIFSCFLTIFSCETKFTQEKAKKSVFPTCNYSRKKDSAPTSMARSLKILFQKNSTPNI